MGVESIINEMKVNWKIKMYYPLLFGRKLQQHNVEFVIETTETALTVSYTLSLTKILDDYDAANKGWQKMIEPNSIVWAPLEEALTKYQDPASADQIMKIQKNLDETRDVLHGTIESVLQRGEKLEDLVERSGELSAQSKLFYKQAKRANSCCAVV